MNTSTTSVVARLESVIGAAHVNGDAEFCERYAVDGIVPSAVVKPTSAVEVAEIVGYAKSHNLALIPCGSCTKLGVGMPPTRYDFALDMTGLNQIAYYDPSDLTLSVDAGMHVAQLADVLGKQNQFVPLAVPFLTECTVGGTIASGIGSALRHSYGSARDFLLGAEFVNGTGALTKSGGRVVKNVTGYDLHKLLIGSLGTLAVVTRLNFRTFPSPPGYGHLVIAFSSVEAIVRFQTLVAKSPLTPTSFEILGPEVAQGAAEFKADGDSPLPSWFTRGLWHVYVAFEGTEAILRRYSSDLVQYAQQSGASNCNLLDEPENKVVRSGLREILGFLVRSSAAATIFRINVLPVFPADVLRLRVLAERRSIQCTFVASGSGLLYFVLQPDTVDDGTIASLVAAASGVFEFAASHGGQASILFCPTELKHRINIWGPAREDTDLMRRLKIAFDPHNIFAPGRFVAGI